MRRRCVAACRQTYLVVFAMNPHSGKKKMEQKQLGNPVEKAASVRELEE
ncbi:hypothetical protein [uncultured Nostoc sp.]